MKQLQVTVNSPSGLHARPASILVKEAMSFNSEIKLIKNDKEFNLKSLLGILSAGISNSDVIELIVEGEDEEAAAAKIRTIIEEELSHV